MVGAAVNISIDSRVIIGKRNFKFFSATFNWFAKTIGDVLFFAHTSKSKGS